jgi:CRISPR-associated protein Csx14
MLEARPVTFVCTLGGQPQVVTFALDALLAGGTAVTDVVILHLASPYKRLDQSLTRLQAEFAGGLYQGRPLRLHLHPLCLANDILADIHDETDANAAWEAINQLIIDLKNERRTLHIGISGGRRILGLLTMSAAMLHFGHQDILWHMYTPDDLRQSADEGAIMHPPADSGFRLIRVPMMPWGSYFPALRQLARPLAEQDVLAAPRRLLDEVERERCTAVLHHLTDRQREVLFAFAEGMNPQRVAEKLVITLKTVDSHKTVILAECRNAWNLPEAEWLDYRFIADKFEAVREK